MNSQIRAPKSRCKSTDSRSSPHLSNDSWTIILDRDFGACITNLSIRKMICRPTRSRSYDMTQKVSEYAPKFSNLEIKICKNMGCFKKTTTKKRMRSEFSRITTCLLKSLQALSFWISKINSSFDLVFASESSLNQSERIWLTLNWIDLFVPPLFAPSARFIRHCQYYS